MNRSRMDSIRFSSNAYQNHVIDEFRGGRLDRRSFLRMASVVGISAAAIPVLAACGPVGAPAPAASTGGVGAPGGTIRPGILAPGGIIDPVRHGSFSNVALVNQAAEYLTLSSGSPTLRPVLATEWSPNDDATKWTFKIRKGVTFNDGTPLTARDVAATFNRLADPANTSTALSALGGVLNPGGAQAIDDETVLFELEAPNGAFSWVVSSDLFAAVILPENYDDDFQDTFIGTGPFKLKEYNTDERAVFTRNPDYWGGPALPDEVEFTMFADDASLVLALQSKSVDLLGSVSYVNGRAVIEDPDNFTTHNIRSSAHRLWSMRTDVAPLDDARVRRAIALSLDREVLVDSLLNGLADVGNDTPIAPVFEASPSDAPQRKRDLAEAKELLAAAGYAGQPIELVARSVHEIPLLAQVAQEQLAEAGIKVDLKVLDSANWSGEGVLGSSPGRDGQMGIDSWGSRGVANSFLTGQLGTGASGNASRYSNPEYDDLVKQFIATADIQSQRKLAKKIQDILQEDTPAIYAYYVNWLSASVKEITGYEFTAMGSLNLSKAQRAK